MSRSSKEVMPVLIINLGCEMIYVLNSRLKAQNIEESKSITVLNDVVSSLFRHEFVEELFKRQDIKSYSYVKDFFDKLAHSSIMKLNSNSMSKLYDLMVMSLKLQLMRIRNPNEIANITYNHINSILDIIKSKSTTDNDVVRLVENIYTRIHFFFKFYTSWDFIILKQTLFKFFQGKNVKVSIFIQDNVQDEKGSFNLCNNDPAYPLVNKPGFIQYFNNNKSDQQLIVLKLSKIYKTSVSKYYN